MIVTVYCDTPPHDQIDIEPHFVHFTPVANIPSLLATGHLGYPPDNIESGCTSTTTALYCYNITVAQRYQCFVTLPPRCVVQPDQWRAIVFRADPSLFHYYPEEVVSRWQEPDLEHHVPVPFLEPSVLTVEDGLKLLGTSLEAQQTVRQRKKESIHDD